MHTRRLWLTKLREARGLTQSALGQQLGVHRVAVTQWESGTYSPSRENAYALARVLGPEVHVHLAAEELADPPSGEEVA